jgi:hypothetical protein
MANISYFWHHLCISFVSLINLLSFGLSYNPQSIHDPLSTSGHKTSSSIIIIIVTVDHLVRPGRTVQYRGRGYSNRFLHSAEVVHFTHTMGHLASWSHSGGPALLQRNLPNPWLFHRTTGNHPPPESCAGCPLCHVVTPATVMAKQTVPNGDLSSYNQTGLTRLWTPTGPG